MFDSNILYFAYDNAEGDEFGVGYLSNKEEWIDRINQWGRNNGTRHDYTVDNFEELGETALQGVILAEVEPIEKDYLVTWVDGEDENSMRITAKGAFVWEINNTKNTSVPRWLTRVRRTIKERNVA